MEREIKHCVYLLFLIEIRSNFAVESPQSQLENQLVFLRKVTNLYVHEHAGPDLPNQWILRYRNSFEFAR